MKLSAHHPHLHHPKQKYTTTQVTPSWHVDKASLHIDIIHLFQNLNLEIGLQLTQKLVHSSHQNATHTCTCTHRHTQTHTHTHTPTHTYTHPHIHTHTHTHKHSHTHIHTHTPTHTPTPTYARTHTHTHTLCRRVAQGCQSLEMAVLDRPHHARLFFHREIFCTTPYDICHS